MKNISSGAQARWLRVGALLTDVVFGYAPLYVGFWLALFSYRYDEGHGGEFEMALSRAPALLATIVGYLIVVQFLFSLWTCRSSKSPIGADRSGENAGFDRFRRGLLELVATVRSLLLEQLIEKVVGRPLEAALALILFDLGRQAIENPALFSTGSIPFFYIWSLAVFIGPLVLGFRQVWEGSGRTIGRSLFGLQIQDNDGRPAGFVRLLMRDGVLRPLTWLGAYLAFGLLLIAAVWLLLPVLLLSALLSGGNWASWSRKLRLLPRPFVTLWYAVAGGSDDVTLHDLLAGTRVHRWRAEASPSPPLIPALHRDDSSRPHGHR